jgi:hypothetical protein
MSTLKMYLNIELISDKIAIIKAEYVNLKILVKDGIIFTSKEGFNIEVSDNLSLSLNRLTLPENVIGCDDGTCEHRMTFHSDELRYEYFKNLNKTLLEFSTSENITNHSYKRDEDDEDEAQLIFYESAWYLY